MTVVRQDDHYAESLTMLLEQFKGKASIAALLASSMTQVQELEDEAFNVLTLRALDVAEGAQLDAIGTIVNLLRDGLTDTEYRARLRIQILINLSSGTAADVLEVFRQLVPTGALLWTDNHPAAFTLDIGTATLSGAQLAVILQRVKAAAVRALLVYGEPGDAPFFSFGPDPDLNGDTEGFDTGAFVSVLE